MSDLKPCPFCGIPPYGRLVSGPRQKQLPNYIEEMSLTIGKEKIMVVW